MKATYEYGIDAEIAARKYLENLGYEFMAQRLKTPFGELDLIMKHGSVIVFVEVKARKFLDHYEVITKKQIERNRAAASYYIASNKSLQNNDLRMDLVIVCDQKIQEHIQNAY